MIYADRRHLFMFVFCAITITAGYSLSQPENTDSEFFNIKPTNEHISYLYGPGLMATEMTMGRYCPKFTAITGEKFTFKKGGHVIGQPHSAVIFPEIDLRKPGYFTWNPIIAWFNRIRSDLFPLFFRLFKETFDFEVEEDPESTLSVVNYSWNFWHANGAQKKDIQAVNKTYQDHLKKYPDTQIILYGDSRGSTTLFNFIAEHSPKQIKAAILESPFDNMTHYMKHVFYVDKEARSEERLHGIYSFLMGSYKKNGPTARKYAEIINDNIPLLFVTSLKDGLVAAQCTMYLYKRLLERGHKNIHILVLENSSHTGYMLDNESDKEVYEKVVHAFYKYYNLPHNSSKAAQGSRDFQNTQPSAQDLDSLYNLQSCQYCWKLTQPAYA